jgi:hypothetical protein
VALYDTIWPHPAPPPPQVDFVTEGPEALVEDEMVVIATTNIKFKK